MRKVFPGVVLGIVFIGVGLIFLLNSLGITDISFDGWWTLFIIVPSLSSMATNRPNAWNVGGLLFGLWLLAKEQDWLPRQLDGYFLLGFIAVVVGLMLIIGAAVRSRPPRESGGSIPGSDHLNHTVIFGSQEINYTAPVTGGSLTAVFGAIELDLRQAPVVNNAVVDITTFFGGIEIVPPQDVRVNVTGTPIFGGFENKAAAPSDPGAPTLTFHVTSVFGGVEIKRA